MSAIMQAINNAKIKKIPNMSEDEIMQELRNIWREEATKEVVAEALDRIKEFHLR